MPDLLSPDRCQAVIAELLHRLFLLDRLAWPAADHILAINGFITPPTTGGDQAFLLHLEEGGAFSTFTLHKFLSFLVRARNSRIC